MTDTRDDLQTVDLKFARMKHDLRPEICSNEGSEADAIRWRMVHHLFYQRIKCSKMSQRTLHHRPYVTDRNTVEPDSGHPPIFLKCNMRRILNHMHRSQFIPGTPQDAGLLFTVESPRRARRRGGFKRARPRKEDDDGERTENKGYDYDSYESTSSPSLSPDSDSKLTNIKINTSTARSRHTLKRMGRDLNRQSRMMGTYFIHSKKARIRRSRRLFSS